MKKRKIILFIFVILIVCVFLYQLNKKQNNLFQEELIFFKLFSSGNTSISNDSKNQGEKISKQYHFKVTYHDVDLKDIYLADTIQKETLIHEKIAPGTKGVFEIVLESDQKINYQINFESKNEKPENLIFQVEGNDRKYKRLEDMQEQLKGEVIQNKKIVIRWQWEYEKNAIQDRQDTKDGENIKQYYFTIYARGESMK